eukprot:8895026-Pyramimonas_sp.AAC.1
MGRRIRFKGKKTSGCMRFVGRGNPPGRQSQQLFERTARFDSRVSARAQRGATQTERRARFRGPRQQQLPRWRFAPPSLASAIPRSSFHRAVGRWLETALGP